MEKSIKCPLCTCKIVCKNLSSKEYCIIYKNTYIYICPECPFVGLEYYGDRNIEALTKYLNRDK